MRRDSPLVSVIILSYNHSRFILETLDSVRAQTYPRTELIVIDDASMDDSVPRVRAWAASRGVSLRLIENPANFGICKSLNRALAVATGDFVAVVASDDRWLPRKLESQVAQIERLGTGTGLVYGDAYCIDELGERLVQRFISSFRPVGRPPDDEVFDALQEGNFIPAPSTLVQKACYHQVGSYDETLLYEDWDMWLRIACRFRVAYCEEVGAEYRALPDSLTRRQLFKGSPAAIETTARIAQKWIRHRRLAERHKRAWAERLVGAARALFQVRHPASARVLWWAVLASPAAQRKDLVKMLARCLWALSRGRFVPIEH